MPYEDNIEPSNSADVGGQALLPGLREKILKWIDNDKKNRPNGLTIRTAQIRSLWTYILDLYMDEKNRIVRNYENKTDDGTIGDAWKQDNAYMTLTELPQIIRRLEQRRDELLNVERRYREAWIINETVKRRNRIKGQQ
jgi:hypothetical protein